MVKRTDLNQRLFVKPIMVPAEPSCDAASEIKLTPANTLADNSSQDGNTTSKTPVKTNTEDTQLSEPAFDRNAYLASLREELERTGQWPHAKSIEDINESDIAEFREQLIGKLKEDVSLVCANIMQVRDIYMDFIEAKAALYNVKVVYRPFGASPARLKQNEIYYEKLLDVNQEELVPPELDKYTAGLLKNNIRKLSQALKYLQESIEPGTQGSDNWLNITHIDHILPQTAPEALKDLIKYARKAVSYFEQEIQERELYDPAITPEEYELFHPLTGELAKAVLRINFEDTGFDLDEQVKRGERFHKVT